MQELPCQTYEYEVRPREDPPCEIPYTATEENVPRLKDWLLQRFAATTFNVSRNPLPVMKGAHHHIHLREGATPYACHTPIPVPKHWEDEVKAQLDEDVKLGVIQEVPAGTATDWCARMVVVAKKNGKPRRTVDYQELNKNCKRETHHTSAPFDMVSSVPLRTYKTVVDAYAGFHQVPLDEESRQLTTFITPWGRYQYCRTPMGHCSAPDAYTKRFDDIIIDVQRKYKCIDDVLLYDESIEGAFWHTLEFLKLCGENGITLNPDKFRFCQRQVEFVGYELDWDNYKPSDERMSAIRNFPMPANPTITDIRSWFGLVNQIAPFVAVAPIMEPFRDLLKRSPHRKVYWDQHLQNSFVAAQDSICKMLGDGLTYYDKARRTAVVTDWCREGMGFVVLQQYCNCEDYNAPFCCKGGWKLALCGSRHLTEAEAGYAVVEGEAAAVVWCLRKARLFLLGCPNFILVTDHRPLVKLFGNRSLKDIANPRLLRLKEKTMQFNFTIKYIPGKKNSAADTLSRYPVVRSKTTAKDEEEDERMNEVCIAVMTSSLADDVITVDWTTVREEANNDPDYLLLLRRVSEGGWPSSRSQVEACLKPFFNVRDRLSVVEGLITYAYDEGHVRLVVPEALRSRITANLHSSHQSTDSMIRRARQAVYWPGIEGDLANYRARCHACNVAAPSQQRESLVYTPPPEYPFQRTVADLFQVAGRHYMVYADRLTGWMEIYFFANETTSSRLIPVFRRYFMQWGAPEEIAVDEGTNLTSAEMKRFFERWGVSLRVSSAHYPQSNGRAEAAVRTAKRTLMDNALPNGGLDNDTVAQAILQYRNTPLRGIDKSPAQLAMGRQLRDSVPMLKSHHLVTEHWSETLAEREKERNVVGQRVSLRYNEKAKDLLPLGVGEKVAIQNVATRAWDRSGVIVEKKGFRQYCIRLDGSGRISMRNRKHLKPLPRVGRLTPPTIQEEQPPAPIRDGGGRIRRRPRWHDEYVLY